MRFTGICIVTEDLPRLREFYGALLGAKAEGNEGFCFIRVDGAQLSIYTTGGMEQMASGSMDGAGTGAYTIEVEVEDVDREAERAVERGIEIVKPPTTQPWGRRSVWLRDPDGNIVNLYKQVPVEPGSVYDTNS